MGPVADHKVVAVLELETVGVRGLVTAKLPVNEGLDVAVLSNVAVVENDSDLEKDRGDWLGLTDRDAVRLPLSLGVRVHVSVYDRLRLELTEAETAAVELAVGLAVDRLSDAVSDNVMLRVSEAVALCLKERVAVPEGDAVRVGRLAVWLLLSVAVVHVPVCEGVTVDRVGVREWVCVGVRGTVKYRLGLMLMEGLQESEGGVNVRRSVRVRVPDNEAVRMWVWERDRVAVYDSEGESVVGVGALGVRVHVAVGLRVRDCEISPVALGVPVLVTLPVVVATGVPVWLRVGPRVLDPVPEDVHVTEREAVSEGLGLRVAVCVGLPEVLREAAKEAVKEGLGLRVAEGGDTEGVQVLVARAVTVTLREALGVVVTEDGVDVEEGVAEMVVECRGVGDRLWDAVAEPLCEADGLNVRLSVEVALTEGVDVMEELWVPLAVRVRVRVPLGENDGEGVSPSVPLGVPVRLKVVVGATVLLVEMEPVWVWVWV